MKIVILDGYTENPGDLSWEAFESLGELVVYDRTCADKIVERMQDSEVVYTNKTPICESVIKQCPKLKFIGVLATGYNIVDTEAAKNAAAFGMKILAYSRHRNEELEDENIRYTDLENLLAQSDVISLHCPLLPSTEGIINKDSIAKMKDGVKIINTSRGPLIIEKDLADALNSGKVSGAAVDVVSTEPIKKENPLLTAKNIIITPHIAWAPKESRQRLMDIAADNLRKYIEGNPQNVVNGVTV